MPEARGADAEAAEAAVLGILVDPGRRFVVACHRTADGDAVGSMLGLARALRGRGADVVMWNADADPVPADLRFLLAPGERVLATLPPDAGERTLVALDCASEHRLSDHPPRGLAALVLNVDHHHDNTRFGHVDLVDAGASSSAEIVVRLLEGLGLPLTREVGEPLYVGLMTDTGRFSYSNTTPRAHRVAAALLEAGVDGAALYRTVYEDVPFADLRLLGRAIDRARTDLDGRMVVAVLDDGDMDEVGSRETEGIVEALRATRGAEVAVLLRLAPNGGRVRVSLRASGDAVDVSRVARAGGGGGHRQAAGFSADDDADTVLARVRDGVREQLPG